MLKHKKVMAILLSLMMVLCLTPTIAFAADEPSITINGGNDISATVGTTIEVIPTVSGVDGDYHIHWESKGSPKKYSVEASPKKIAITANAQYDSGKYTELTAYLYKGKKCGTNEYFVNDGTSVCNEDNECIAKSNTVKFTAVAGTDTEDFNSLGIKLKKYGTIKKDTVIPVKRWETAELTAAVDDHQEFSYEWTKGSGKEVVNFIEKKDGSENELSNEIETVSGNPIKIKGLVAQEGTITVTAYTLDENDNTKKIIHGSATFTVSVVSDMTYGPQGSTVYGYNDPQTVEIVKIGDSIVSDADINGTKGINSPGVAFTNSFTNSLTDTDITFFIGKGMGAQFDKDKFNKAAMPYIEVLSKDGKRIDGFTGIELIGRNIDRSITVRLPIGKLEEGKYILRFNKGLAPKSDGQPLGTNVDFWFKVGDPVPVIGDYDVMSRIEISKTDFKITQDLKDNGIDTKEEVLNAMYEAALKLIGFDVNEDNSVVYDVKLLISTDGGKEWKPATKENFPKEGIKLELNYPEGTSAETQNFEVLHMVTVDGNGMKAGDVEKLNVKEGKEKLQVTVNSLSPFLIAWEDADAEAGINDGSAETGDNMNIALYAGIMILALCGGAAVFARRRKEQ
ncbi:MAG: LPXTG cell wall anchor domain-containing protein [Firmicutes bacterium]|nr:LPXTG cell wall anchor domain-containing protein [Bacillota bacterium]